MANNIAGHLSSVTDSFSTIFWQDSFGSVRITSQQQYKKNMTGQYLYST